MQLTMAGRGGGGVPGAQLRRTTHDYLPSLTLNRRAVTAVGSVSTLTLSYVVVTVALRATVACLVESWSGGGRITPVQRPDSLIVFSQTWPFLMPASRIALCCRSQDGSFIYLFHFMYHPLPWLFVRMGHIIAPPRRCWSRRGYFTTFCRTSQCTPPVDKAGWLPTDRASYR